MAIDLDDIEKESRQWIPTMNIRWFRPRGGSDQDVYLEQLWERTTGERSWRKIQTCLED